MRNKNFHKDFTLQGRSFSSITTLLEYTRENTKPVYPFLAQWFDGTEYIEVKTSGSTGKPKMIRLLKKNMVNSARATGEYFGLTDNTNALLCMSPNYIAGKMMLVRALVLGWNLDVVEPAQNPLTNLDKSYDFSAMVPSQLYNSLNYMDRVELLIVGGGVVSEELQTKIQSLKTKIFATYGMTETISHIAVRKLNHFSEISRRSQAEYKALPGVFLSVDNRQCLKIEAPHILENSLITNDLVALTSKNSFKWLGRFDNIINSGGIKLIPEQIEDKLSQLFQQRFFVIGINDKVLGQKLVLVIEAIGPVKASVILQEIKDAGILSKYETPREIYTLEKFIETPSGKINRNKSRCLLAV